jgi:hypothetical protein
MLREPLWERILTRLAKPTFDEIVRKDDEDAISVSNRFGSVARLLWPARGGELLG